MDSDLLAKLSAAFAAVGAALYGALRLIKRDRREDKVAAMTDDAVSQVIATLRDEIDRLSKRLAAVEEQNRLCEQRNDELHAELLELKKQLHLA